MKNLKQYVSILIVLCVCMAVTAVMTAESMAQLTEQFTENGLMGASKLIIHTLLLFLLDGAICYGYRLLCGHMEAKVYANVQQKSFYQLAHIPMDSALLENQGDLYSRINRDSAELTEFFSITLPKILMQSVQLILIIGYLFVVDWRITIIYLVTVLVTLGIQAVLSKYLKQASEKVKKTEVAFNTRLKDTLENRLMIKTYEAYDFMEELCQQSAKEYAHANIHFNLRSMPIKIAGILCGLTPTVAVCLAGLFLVPSGFIKLASFMTCYYLCEKILPYQLHYVDLFMDGIKFKVIAKRMIQLWEEPVLEDCVPNVSKNQEDIVLQNISYRYPNTKEWAVQNISMHIQAGKKVAFIGKSGCGKSTVMKLMSGLLQPQEGSIHVPDNRLTGQFPNFFSGTMEENICCFAKGDEEEVRKACKHAGVDRFVQQLHDGRNTVIKNNGIHLSGGQRQRIALARTLYTNSPVLLFDESFSALDADNAKAVIQNVIKEYPLSTIIMILHQTEFLPMMDEIYVFDNGKIKAHGTYDELREQNVLGEELL